MEKLDNGNLSEVLQWLKFARLSYSSILIGIFLGLATDFFSTSSTLSGILTFIARGSLIAGIIVLHIVIKKLKSHMEDSEVLQWLKSARLSYRSILIGIFICLASPFLHDFSSTLSGIFYYIGLGAIITGIIELHRFINKLKFPISVQRVIKSLKSLR